jgi:hypothetical protein
MEQCVDVGTELPLVVPCRSQLELIEDYRFTRSLARDL